MEVGRSGCCDSNSNLEPRLRPELEPQQLLPPPYLVLGSKMNGFFPMLNRGKKLVLDLGKYSTYLILTKMYLSYLFPIMRS